MGTILLQVTTDPSTNKAKDYPMDWLHWTGLTPRRALETCSNSKELSLPGSSAYPGTELVARPAEGCDHRGVLKVKAEPAPKPLAL